MAENTKDVAETEEKSQPLEESEGRVQDHLVKNKALKQSAAVICVSVCLGVTIVLIDTVIKFGLGFIL
ncbi:MAG: hypothetical protein V8S32_09590 [Lachnospiraceae bacterium]